MVLRTEITKDQITFYDENDNAYASIIPSITANETKLSFKDNENNDLELLNLKNDHKTYDLLSNGSSVTNEGVISLSTQTNNNFVINSSISDNLQKINIQSDTKGQNGYIILNLTSLNENKQIEFLMRLYNTYVYWVNEDLRYYEPKTYLIKYVVFDSNTLLLWNVNNSFGSQETMSYTPVDSSKTNFSLNYTIENNQTITLPSSVNTFTAILYGGGGNGYNGGYTQSTVTLPENGLTLYCIIGASASVSTGGGATVIYYTKNNIRYDVLVAGGGGNFGNGGGLIANGYYPGTQLNGSISEHYTTGIGQSDFSGAGYFAGTYGSGGSGFIGTNITLYSLNTNTKNYGNENKVQDITHRFDQYNKCIYNSTKCYSSDNLENNYYRNANGINLGTSNNNGFLTLNYYENISYVNGLDSVSFGAGVISVIFNSNSIATHWKYFIFQDASLVSTDHVAKNSTLSFNPSFNGVVKIYAIATNTNNDVYYGIIVSTTHEHNLLNAYDTSVNLSVNENNVKIYSINNNYISNLNESFNINIVDSNLKTYNFIYNTLPKNIYISYYENFKIYGNTKYLTDSSILSTSSYNTFTTYDSYYIKSPNYVYYNNDITIDVSVLNTQFILSINGTDLTNLNYYVFVPGTTVTFNYTQDISHVLQIYQSDGTTKIYYQTDGNSWYISENYLGNLVIQCANHSNMGTNYHDILSINYVPINIEYTNDITLDLSVENKANQGYTNDNQFVLKHQGSTLDNSKTYLFNIGINVNFNFNIDSSHILEIYKEDGTLLYNQSTGSSTFKTSEYIGKLELQCSNHSGMGEYYNNTLFFKRSISKLPGVSQHFVSSLHMSKSSISNVSLSQDSSFQLVVNTTGIDLVEGYDAYFVLNNLEIFKVVSYTNVVNFDLGTNYGIWTFYAIDGNSNTINASESITHYGITNVSVLNKSYIDNGSYSLNLHISSTVNNFAYSMDNFLSYNIGVQSNNNATLTIYTSNLNDIISFKPLNPYTNTIYGNIMHNINVDFPYNPSLDPIPIMKLNFEDDTSQDIGVVHSNLGGTLNLTNNQANYGYYSLNLTPVNISSYYGTGAANNASNGQTAYLQIPNNQLGNALTSVSSFSFWVYLSHNDNTLESTTETFLLKAQNMTYDKYWGVSLQEISEDVYYFKFQYYIHQTSTWIDFVPNTTFSSSQIFDQWTHLVIIVYPGTTFPKMYINNVEKTLSTTQENSWYSTRGINMNFSPEPSITLGSVTYFLNYSHVSQIDEFYMDKFEIYNSILNTTQINNLYNVSNASGNKIKVNNSTPFISNNNFNETFEIFNFSFENNSGNVEYIKNVNYNTEFTISLWIYFNHINFDINGSNYIWGSSYDQEFDGGLYFQLQQSEYRNSHFKFVINGYDHGIYLKLISANEIGILPFLNKWHNFVFVFNENSPPDLFLNNSFHEFEKSQESNDWSTFNFSLGQDFIVGSRYNVDSQFDGNVDSITIYNSPLTIENISQLYNDVQRHVFEIDFTNSLPNSTKNCNIPIIYINVNGAPKYSIVEKALDLTNINGYVLLDISSVYSGKDFTLEFEANLSTVGQLWTLGNYTTNVKNGGLGIDQNELVYHDWEHTYNNTYGSFNTLQNSENTYKTLKFTYDGSTTENWYIGTQQHSLRKNIYVDNFYLVPNSEKVFSKDTTVKFSDYYLQIGYRNQYPALSSNGYIRKIRFYDYIK